MSSRANARDLSAPRRNLHRRSRLAYLGLGSNIGDRRRHLQEAVAAISRIGRLRRVSSLYSTEPVGFRAQRRFWNAAAEILWDGSAKELLEAVKEIERKIGRTPTFEGGPREIDVDILDLAGLIRDGDPILPHPRIAERRFVLAPLAEIAPGWRHPVLGKTAVELLEELPRRPGARRLGTL